MIARRMLAEAWFAKRLGRFDLFAVGATTLEQRAEIARQRIHYLHMADAPVAPWSGSTETIAQAFERLFHEPLGPRFTEPEKPDPEEDPRHAFDF